MKGTTYLNAYVEARDRHRFWKQAWEHDARTMGLASAQHLLDLSTRYSLLAQRCRERVEERLERSDESWP